MSTVSSPCPGPLGISSPVDKSILTSKVLETSEWQLIKFTLHDVIKINNRWTWNVPVNPVVFPRSRAHTTLDTDTAVPALNPAHPSTHGCAAERGSFALTTRASAEPSPDNLYVPRSGNLCDGKKKQLCSVINDNFWEKNFCHSRDSKHFCA